MAFVFLGHTNTSQTMFLPVQPQSNTKNVYHLAIEITTPLQAKSSEVYVEASSTRCEKMPKETEQVKMTTTATPSITALEPGALGTYPFPCSIH